MVNCNVMADDDPQHRKAGEDQEGDPHHLTGDRRIDGKAGQRVRHQARRADGGHQPRLELMAHPAPDESECRDDQDRQDDGAECRQHGVAALRVAGSALQG
jgi:hypothetical protein